MFLVNPVVSQRIEKGTYQSLLYYSIDPITHEETYYMEYSEVIRILNDSLFEYKYFDDVTYNIGYGFYTLNKSILTLNFTGQPSNIDTTSCIILLSELSKGDSVNYKFIVKNILNNRPLSGAIISYKNCGKNQYDSSAISRLGCETDDDGIAYLKIAKNQLPCKVIITYVGLHSYIYYLNDTLSKTVELRMKDNSRYIPKGKVINYIVKDIDEDGFYVLGGIWIEWTFFRRLDE